MGIDIALAMIYFKPLEIDVGKSSAAYPPVK
jgi:hypothetical protein